jgi:hypothetical protein
MELRAVARDVRTTTAQLTAYGWFGTALVLTLFASATGIAAAGIARSGTLRGAQRADAVHFGMTLLAVVAIAATALVPCGIRRNP